LLGVKKWICSFGREIRNEIFYDLDYFKTLPTIKKNANTFMIEGFVIPFNEENTESKINKNEAGEEVIEI